MYTSRAKGEPINYDQDEIKHYVRLVGWQPACAARARRVAAQVSTRRDPRKKPLKYFTLCASRAVDVFMLERANVILRSPKTQRLESVYWCESDKSEYGQIVERVGPNGLLGRLEEIVLFEDDSDTRRYSLDDNPRVEIRRKLENKEQHERLVRAFPFDIINLDVCGTFFPPDQGKISPILRSLRKILDWQRRKDPDEDFLCKEFTLLLTSYVDDSGTNTDALCELVQRVRENLKYSRFQQAYEAKWGNRDPGELSQVAFPAFFSIALPKVLMKEGLQRDWDAQYKGIYLYQRQHGGTPYWMMSSVTHFERFRSPAVTGTLHATYFEAQQNRYIEESAEVVECAPIIVNEKLKEGDTVERVRDDLVAVTQYRDAKLERIRSAN